MRLIIGFFNHFLSGQIQQGCMGIKSGSERWSVHSQTIFLGISASHFPWSKSKISFKKSRNLKNLGLKTVSLSYCIVLHQVGGNFTSLPQFFKWDVALNVIIHMTQLQMFQKVEYGWGPIFKVVPECSKRYSEPFLIYIYGIQCDFMPKSCWKHSNFENR